MPDIFTASNTTKKYQNHNHQNIQDHIKSVPGLFSSLVNYPDGLKFAHQEEKEEILLFTRRSFYSNIPWIIIAILAIFVPLLFYGFMQQLNATLFTLSLPAIIILHIFYYLVLFGFAFYSYIDWFYNIGIITDKRVLDIDFMHLSYIDIAITQLPDIEDVVHKQQGFFASFFDYGDVVAHTVSSREDFVFEKIPHPTKVVDRLSKLIAG